MGLYYDMLILELKPLALLETQLGLTPHQACSVE
ncbi:hypothetical protein DAI22_01g246000 [Oryza sativa Japonica Group]|nr:hypothetical protein DAI22_01g246000 [Oryza sativa Japonica Group]